MFFFPPNSNIKIKNIKIEKRTKANQELCQHLSTIINSHEELVSRLQKPFLGQHIKIDPPQQRFFYF